MFGTKTESREWVSVGRECHSYAPAAPLGWCPGTAVVKTTYLKWVLMFFTAGKYAFMGIFALHVPGPRCLPPPRQAPTHTTHFIFPLPKACLSLYPHAASVRGLHTEEQAQVSLLSVSESQQRDWGDVTRLTAGWRGRAQEPAWQMGAEHQSRA